MRNSQGYCLSGPSLQGASGGTAFDSDATAQIDLLLQDLVIDTRVDAGTANTGVVTALSISGQSVFVTSSAADILSWAPDAQLEGSRSLGIPISQNSIVNIKATLDTAGSCASTIGTDPLPIGTPVIPINALGPALDYCGGIGTVTVAAAASTGVTATDTTVDVTILRPVRLGRLVMSQTGASSVTQLVVSSIKLNQMELLSGGSNSEVPFSCFDRTSTDLDGMVLDVFTETPNAVLSITFKSWAGQVATVHGTFFCLPA